MLHNYICMICYQYPCHSEADKTVNRKYFPPLLSETYYTAHIIPYHDCGNQLT